MLHTAGQVHGPKDEAYVSTISPVQMRRRRIVVGHDHDQDHDRASFIIITDNHQLCSVQELEDDAPG